MDVLEVDGMTGLEEYLIDTLESVIPEADECGDRGTCNLVESVVSLEEGSVEPYVGMEFSSKQMAYDFYNTYGFITGFSIRTNTFNKNVQGVITSVRLVCSKEGFAKGKKRQMEEPLESVSDTISEKQTSLHRCGCKASCTVRLHEDGKWRVSTFYKEHNHAFVQNTPSKKRHLRSHKQISMKERAEIELLKDINVGAAKIREYLAEKAGGKENLHYSKKDVNNQIGKANKKLVRVDANALVDYFRRRQQDDPDFLFDIEPDEDKAVRNILWVDGRLRRAYQEFGDVVVFDTTYQTNKYSMPMGPFIGVNHHRQSIFFGCALIRDEKKTTFYWLFTTWLQAMGGRKPKSIFTDQCPSMKAAIEKVFGVDTIHRCCLWHVMIKAKEHLGVIYGVVKGFKDEFSDLIMYSWTIEDFEANWIAFVKKYKMEGNKHLKVMFDKRDEWAPAYFRETFCAGMSTTQRSESINAVTKIWMDSNTSLYDFATKFEKMVQGVYEKESDEDIRTLNEVPQLSTTDPIEAEARRVYTRNMFSHFKAELKKCGGLRIHEVEKDKLYEVRPAKAKVRYEWYKPNHMVYIDKANGKADCDCKKFLFEGFLCSHALEVMRLTSMEPFLPEHYILKRWTRDANTSVKKGTNERSLEGINLDSVMLNALTQRWQILSKEALKHHVTYEMVCTKLDDLVGEATESNQRIFRNTPMQRKELTPCEASQSLKFHDPPVSHCKGKRRPERFKRPMEVKDAKKMRTYSYCHRKEGHNMRKCPKKENDEKLGLGQTQELFANEEEDYNEDGSTDYNEGDNSYDSDE